MVYEGFLSAHDAMQRDFDLLENGQTPVLRIYRWKNPSISLGIINREGNIDENKDLHNHIDVIKRPTGGATLLHGHDISFSLFVPDPTFLQDSKESYLVINQALIRAASSAFGIELDRFRCAENGVFSSRGGFCMAEHSLFDPLLDGKKVGGAAQRRTRRGFLHQGSLFLSEPQWNVFEDVFDQDVLSKMKQSITWCGVDERELGFFCDEMSAEIFHITACLDSKSSIRQGPTGCEVHSQSF